MLYYSFGSEPSSRRIATDLILQVHEEQNASRESESKNSLSLFLTCFPSLRRLGLLTEALRNPRKFYFPAAHVLLTDGQTVEVLSKHHR